MIVSLNFNTMKASPSLCLGRIGEHNATDLEITWTNSDERIASYRVAFQTGGKSILSDSFSSMPIEVALWQQLTLNPRLSIQIIAYDVNGDYIGKSDKFSGLYFAPSVSGINTDIDGEAQDIGAEVTRLEAEVADNTAARHTHSNKTVLDKFGETSGTPTYDGEALGGGLVDDVKDTDGNSLVVNKIATVPTGKILEIVASQSQGVVISKYTRSELYDMYISGIALCCQGVPIDTVIRGDNYYLYFFNGGFNDTPYFSRSEVRADKVITAPSLVGYYGERKYTAAKDTKLSGIATGAEVNVIDTIKDSNGNPLTVTSKSVTLPAIPAAQIQSDWEQSDNTAKDYIKNKPSIPAAQVQADWDESDNTKADYIKNKPTIPDISGKEDTANKVTSLSSSSTDTEYPSAKAVYDALPNIPDGTNTGDILVWNGSAWVAKSEMEFMGYEQLAYIKSNGTQYINTEFKASNHARVVCSFDKGAVGNDNYNIFGSRYALQNNAFCLSVMKDTDAFRSDYAGRTIVEGGIAYTPSSPIQADKNNNVTTVNGTTRTETASTFNGYPIYLFAWFNSNTGAAILSTSEVIMYSCQIYYDGNLARDFVPCRRLIDGKIGMFDKVYKRFYANAGTGEFIIPT